jgi:hypothetical protein
LISGRRIDIRDPVLTEPTLAGIDGRGQARWLPAFGALVALIPFLACAREFRELFWFGDEWDQLAEFHRTGVWRYLTSTFAENFVPLFKAMWLSVIVAGRGSYLIVLAALWVTHALNVLLLGLVLRRIDVRAAGIAVALIWAGLPASNIETLGWTVQWSAVLALSFYLLAVLQFLKIAGQHESASGAFWLLAAASVASSLSFSRGILSGFAIALTCAIPLGIRNLRGRNRALAVLAALLPALAVGAIIASSAQGNHLRLLQPGAVAMTARFAAHFFLLNPLQGIWSLTPNDSLLVVLGATKIAIYVLALIRARETGRWLVWLSLVLDISNAVLVGIGRYHTGLAAAVGSRYQYVPLFCLAPAVAILVDWAVEAVRPVPYLARALTFAMAVLLAWSIASPWREHMRSWSGWRGTEMRVLLQTRRDAGLLPFVATVSTAEAHALCDEFHLH